MTYMLAQAPPGWFILLVVSLFGLGTALGIIACLCASFRRTSKVGIVLGAGATIMGLGLFWVLMHVWSCDLALLFGTNWRTMLILLGTPIGLGALAIGMGNRGR